MELMNTLSVPASAEHAWAVLTDLPLIAPCLPGAKLVQVDGEDHHGIVKVKVGPITAEYKGIARFLERDDASHRAVLRAEGRDSRGQGQASATVTVNLADDGHGTRVDIHTDLAISGKVAQFGRGVMADVSAKLLSQFAERLEATVLNPSETPVEAEGATASPEGKPSPSRRPVPESVEAVDLLDIARSSVLRRAAPTGVAALVLTLLACWLIRHRFSR